MIKEPFVWFQIDEKMDEKSLSHLKATKMGKIGISFNYLNKDETYIDFTEKVRSQVNFPISYFASIRRESYNKTSIEVTDKKIFIDHYFDFDEDKFKDFCVFKTVSLDSVEKYDYDNLLIGLNSYFESKAENPEIDLAIEIYSFVPRFYGISYTTMAILGIQIILIPYTSENFRMVEREYLLEKRKGNLLPKDSNEKIKDYRKKIDELDNQFYNIIIQRLKLVEEIAFFKYQCGVPLFDAKRFKKLIEKSKSMPKKIGVNEDSFEGLFDDIHNLGLTKAIKKIMEFRNTIK